MEMEKKLSNIKNISLDGYETVWKSYRKGRKPFWHQRYKFRWKRNCMEVLWKWKKNFLTSQILVKIKTKLYGSHMEMSKNLSDMKNYSLDGNETVWKSYGNGRKHKKC